MDNHHSNDILVNSSDAMGGHKLEDDDSWVLVEKQIVTILVPTPSPVHHQITSPRRNISRSRKMIRKGLQTPSKKLSKHNGAGKKMHVAYPSEHEIPMDMDAAKISNAQQSPLPPASQLVGLHGEFHKITGSPDSSQPQSSSPAQDDADHMILNGKRTLRKSRSLKIVQFSHQPPVGAVEVVNLRIRAANLERELARLGGLSRWLVSLGLAQFVGLFEKENLDKFRLVNLTMGKLKDMGAEAVGPRRKLIHAIDCISQPYFLKP